MELLTYNAMPTVFVLGLCRLSNFSTLAHRWIDMAGETRRSTSRSAKPSSREINSLEKVKPGISPRFLSQKIEQKLPEKKIPYAQAKAMLLSAKV
ncbi:hypothetical protein BRARA_B00989 [Brassica rapa]|uniref:Uncharacterized protein n=1 Tax=Brassica campestris TaxID=3711 RepID=A0A398AF35_BRACM|nr:hypothetical protein BRARA_B00989 [Brassica rapa]